jgi:predicted metal-dependent hydrolase
VLREYRNGEGFLYLGRAYRLLLVSEGEQDEPLRLRNGRFTLRRDLVEQGEIAAARTAFREFYVARGLERLRRRIAYFAPRVGVSPAGIDVRDLGNRWASCTAAGRLAFHWKCMMAPLTVVDYLVVHELCHFHQRDHSDAFWNEVDKVMPDFRDRKEWLRRNGAGLDV